MNRESGLSLPAANCYRWSSRVCFDFPGLALSSSIKRGNETSPSRSGHAVACLGNGNDSKKQQNTIFPSFLSIDISLGSGFVWASMPRRLLVVVVVFSCSLLTCLPAFVIKLAKSHVYLNQHLHTLSFCSSEEFLPGPIGKPQVLCCCSIGRRFVVIVVQWRGKSIVDLAPQMPACAEE